MRLEHWEWMVRDGCWASAGRQAYGVEHDYEELEREGPDWCFERYGMSRTAMPDGRIICVAGEHEDGYDPDFCIYNDVVVLWPMPGESTVTHDGGEVEIYGYPQEVFPPTDFHSVTLVGSRIYIIGNLGYSEARRPGTTPIYALDTGTYAIEQLLATGTPPGWVYKHHAEFEPGSHSIVVRAGRIMRAIGQDHELAHFGAFRLHLEDLRWETVAQRERHRCISLFATTPHRRGYWEPSDTCFHPRTVPHVILPSDPVESDFARLSVSGVCVWYEQFYDSFFMRVEGELPNEVVTVLLEETLDNLRAESGAEWTSEEKPPPAERIRR